MQKEQTIIAKLEDIKKMNFNKPSHEDIDRIIALICEVEMLAVAARQKKEGHG